MNPHRSYIKFPRFLASASPWTVPDIAPEYGFPLGTMPGGGIIAIGSLGGGYQPTDLRQNFAALGLPAPTVVDVSVRGATNSPGNAADVENMLDLVMAGSAYAVLTGQSALIRFYSAPNDGTAIQDVTRQAAMDGVDVLSWSWGQPEVGWGKQALDDMELAAVVATLAGTVVTAAAGDNDSGDGASGSNVDAPASCPHVVGCGGTMRPHGTTSHAQEIVWNDNPGQSNGEGTGGGWSNHFPEQPWQLGAPHGSGRMVPDLAANADPNTGWKLYVQGRWIVVGGTSAVAPLTAGEFASFGRKLGWVLPKLWTFHMAFWDVTRGNNGMNRALVGPDACSGLGVPRVGRLATHFRK
jgi:subtilase family serine protease